MPQLYSIPNVEIFATGEYRGRQWSLADLQTINANFQQLSVPQNGQATYLHVPVVLGHEEDQAALQRTDLPALGWNESLRLAETGPADAFLIGGFEDVVPELAKWIQEGRIRYCSAEFFENFVDDAGNHHGLTLRRVAVLGGELPQVKRLNALPMPVAKFSQNQKSIIVRSVFKFADKAGGGMNRDDMLKLIQASGVQFAKDFIDSLSDDQVAMLVKSLTGTGEKPADAGADPNAPAPGPQMSDPTPVAAPASPAPAPASAQPSQIIMKYSDLENIVKKAVAPFQAQVALLTSKIGGVEKMNGERINKEKHGKIHKFCEEQVKAGRMLPVQVASVQTMLQSCDDLNKVHKFGDSGETLTELDARMKEIGNWPQVVKFGETMPASDGAKLDADKKARLLSFSDYGREAAKRKSKAAA